MGTERRQRDPLFAWILEVFVLANLSFLALDVYLAHSVNEFALWSEWIPVLFSAAAALLMAWSVLQRRSLQGKSRHIGLAVGIGSVMVGIAGLLFHLGSSFFAAQTIKSLVYTAPFSAPLSYSGLGLLLLLNRMAPSGSRPWRQWVVFLAMFGFIGTLALSLADHAQNGFFEPSEWIPVIASCFAVAFLLTAIQLPRDRWFHKVCLVVMGLQLLVGVAGFIFHLASNLHGPSDSTSDNFLFGAPIFAPLLFPNLAILAAIGLSRLLADPVDPAENADGKGTPVNPSQRAADPPVSTSEGA